MLEERCCKCHNSFPIEEMTLMLSKNNSTNPLHKEFFCCRKCYFQWEELYNKYEGEIDSFSEKNWNVRFEKFWVNLFFNEFLHYENSNPSYRIKRIS